MAPVLEFRECGVSLHYCSGAVGVFYSPCRQGNQMVWCRATKLLHWEIFLFLRILSGGRWEFLSRWFSKNNYHKEAMLLQDITSHVEFTFPDVKKNVMSDLTRYSGPLWHEVVVPVSVSSMDQTELFTLLHGIIISYLKSCSCVKIVGIS